MEPRVITEWDRITIYPSHSQLVTEIKVAKKDVLTLQIPFPHTSYDLWFSPNKEIGKPIHHLFNRGEIQVGVLEDGYLVLSATTDKISAKYHHSLVLDSTMTDIVNFTSMAEILFDCDPLRVKTICLMYGCSQSSTGTQNVDCFRGDFQTSSMHNLDFISLSPGFKFQISTPAVLSECLKVYEYNVNLNTLRVKLSVIPDQFIAGGECKIYTLLKVGDTELPRYLSTTQIESSMYDVELMIDLGTPTKVTVDKIEKSDYDADLEGDVVRKLDVSFRVLTIIDPPEYDFRVVWELPEGFKPEKITPEGSVSSDRKLVWTNSISSNEETYNLHTES